MSRDNLNTLEDLYSPSKWCKRYATSEECIENHIKIITEESGIVRKTVPADLNISYGRLPREKYDIFGTDLPDSSPILFYLHGGYWQDKALGRTNSSYVASVFHKHGIKSFVVGYELCPDVELEDITLQVQQALIKCLEYAKNKGSRGIFLIGHSAGAQLVAHFFNGFTKTLTDEYLSLLRASFLVAGVYDLLPILSTPYNSVYKLTSSRAEKLSPMKQETHRCNTEFFIVVGTNDSPIFVTQSELLDKKLNGEQINTKLVVLDDIDHFNIIENIVDENFKLTQLILETVNKYV